MQNIHQLTLDIFKESLKPSITITQNDIDVNKLVVSVTQNKKTFNLGNLVPILVCLKPSGKYTMNVMEIIDNKLEFTLTQQEVVEAGKVELAILLHGIDGSRVSTMKFDVKVLNELVTLETIESQINTEPLLNNLIMQIESKRDKNMPIGELDLSLELLNKINEPKYDDTDLKQRVDAVEANLTNKRDKDIKIDEVDLSLALKDKINLAGQSGKSAYEVAVENGFIGTELAWLESLKGEKGDNGLQGENGIDGADGLSAYQVWVNQGNAGTELDFLNSLNGSDGTIGVDGKSAYQIAVDNGFVGTELEWINSLKGEQGIKGDTGLTGERGNDGIIVDQNPQGILGEIKIYTCTQLEYDELLEKNDSFIYIVR